MNIVSDGKSRSSGPSFLFIGAGKAGSSWFQEVLWEHPNVFVPPNKGTYFFTKHFGMGVAWYESFFPRDVDDRIIGEVCEDYMLHPEALSRIKAYRPDMRLICCLRNPYERAISAWRFYTRNGIGEPTLAAQFEHTPEVFHRGNYATQMDAVRSRFDPAQVLVILFDEMVAAPEQVVRKVYEFIGADSRFVPQSLHKRVNPNGRPRSRLLARIVHKVHLRARGSSQLVSTVVGHLKRVRHVREVVRTALYDERPNGRSWQDQLSEFPNHVVLRYEQEITALEQMLGLDLSSWHVSGLVVSRSIRQCTSQTETANALMANSTARPDIS